MILSGYGIELIRLQHADIELVRRERNSEDVRMYMEYRDEITREMQEHWFASINNRFNNYFLIKTDDRIIGLIYGAQIDWEKKETGNGGIFIWDKQYHESPVALLASFVLIETSFLLGLERTYVKVLRSNTRAIRFNTDMGYVLLPDQNTVANQRYVLEKETFFQRTQKVRAALQKQHGDTITFLIDHPEDATELFYKALVERLPDATRNRFKIITA
jgi:RimJ/RimL family protein N-acetyltransferase